MTIYIIGDKKYHYNNNDLRTQEVRLKVASLSLNKLHTKQLLNIFNLLKDDPYIKVSDEEQVLNKRSFEWTLSKDRCANYHKYRSLRSLLKLINNDDTFTVKDIRAILAIRENVRRKNKAPYNGYKVLI